MSITVPIALVTDFFIWKKTILFVQIIGAFLVVIGFAMVNMTPENVDLLYKWLWPRDNGMAGNQDADIPMTIMG